MIVNAKIGWDRIKKEFDMLYPNQEPKYYGKQVRYMINEKEPLDAIMVYETSEYYHFITLGFSEIYEKETNNLDISGLGYELSYKLYKNEGVEVTEIIDMLQQIAITPKEYNENDNIFINDNKYLLVMDRQIDTENGKVKILEMKKILQS